MRLVLALLAAVVPVLGQVCPPVPLPPSGSTSGKLDDNNCLLSDWTAYAAYRLDLPVRGRLQAELTGVSADFVMTLRDPAGARVDSGPSFTRPLEAGSYTLLVNGRTPGQVGAYTVRTKFTAEPAIWCTDFPRLGTSQTVSGTLGASGCLLPDSTPYEAYRLPSNALGTLTITTTGADFDPTILVRDEQGWLLASGSGGLTATVDRDREYLVIVHGGGKAGAFKLTTSFEPSADETCRANKTFTQSGFEPGSLTPESCSDSQVFYDFYWLELATPGVAVLRATSTDFEAGLLLLDEAGNRLASNAASLRTQLPAGRYAVHVTSGSVPGGVYQLDYEFTERLPQGCPRGTLIPEELSAGLLTRDTCRTSLGPGDLYALSLPAAGTIVIDMAAADFSPQLALLDAKENHLAVTPAGGTHLTADLPAGDYVVATIANAGSGAYELQAKFRPHELEPCPTIQSLPVNTGYIQRLGPGSCKGANGQPADLYEFILDEDSMVAAVVTSGQMDSYLLLTRPDGAILRQDDNSYSPEDPFLLQYLPAGTYRLQVRNSAATDGGVYRVDLLATPTSAPPLCAPRSTITPGTSLNRSLSYSSCQFPDATFADVYQVKVAKDATLDIRLTSSDFDAELILLDGKGNVVARDQDGGGGTNSRITESVPAGNYFLVAKPSGDYRSGGVYVLTVTQ